MARETVLRIEPGTPWPLGASLDAHGANFALFSASATRVELCLFDPDTGASIGRVDLPACSGGVWHGRLDGWCAPVAYGYRVHGEQDASRGRRFNPAKLLLDPYAQALSGRFEWTESHLEGVHAHEDNARSMVRGLLRPVPGFDWGDDAPPATPMAETVLYEVHVRGFTRLHPDVPEPLRGTYLGLSHPAALAHLKRLGVTALNLLPVHYAIDEQGLAQRGKVNYWGYNTLGFFAANPRYAGTPQGIGGDADLEFRTMVRALHAAGLEVILDVVYNHTAEGDERGPTLCWRGIDNATYYRLREDDPARYENDSGCGNTLNVAHPRVLQMVLDSLRHWVTHYRVDGFRFDLATALARTAQGFDARAAFFQAIAQDPVLCRVKLIAEPWDTGLGGYRLGGFPAGWAEWNDRFRDDVRAFWVQKAGDRASLARRLAGSRDLFGGPDAFGIGRDASASINYVAAHDGFTLEDVVSWSRKHNEANGEHNRDGSSNELSWNCGAEGPTVLRAVLARRRWLKRAMLATLLLARGTPMLLAGDELGRSQRGNNNAYCQDNEIGWVDWSRVDDDLVDFVAALLALRRRHPALRDTRWLSGEPVAGRRRDVVWTDRDGAEMSSGPWNEQNRYMLGVQLAEAGGSGASGSGAGAGAGAGAVAGDARASDARLLLLFNAELEACPFRLPPGRWRCLLDSAADRPFGAVGDHHDGAGAAVGGEAVGGDSVGFDAVADDTDPRGAASGEWTLAGCSVALFEQRAGEGDAAR
ncbi:MAG: glycogen debranching protein GlgX [Lautropia sp.]